MPIKSSCFIRGKYYYVTLEIEYLIAKGLVRSELELPTDWRELEVQKH